MTFYLILLQYIINQCSQKFLVLCVICMYVACDSVQFYITAGGEGPLPYLILPQNGGVQLIEASIFNPHSGIFF